MAFRRGFRTRTRRPRRDRNWVESSYHVNSPPVVPPVVWIDLFELVSPADYSMRPESRNDKSTVLRFIVDFTIDRLVTTEIGAGQTRLVWAAAIIRMGSEAAENQFGFDVSDFRLFSEVPYIVGTWEQRVRMDILQFSGAQEWYQTISPGTAPNPDVGAGNQTGTIYSSSGPRLWHAESSQKRKLARDESLWLLVHAFDAVAQDPNENNYSVNSRVLIAD